MIHDVSLALAVVSSGAIMGMGIGCNIPVLTLAYPALTTDHRGCCGGTIDVETSIAIEFFDS